MLDDRPESPTRGRFCSFFVFHPLSSVLAREWSERPECRQRAHRNYGKNPREFQPARVSTTRENPPNPAFWWRLPLMDVCLGALFLGLTFLLGSFPLKDTDIYWHLRTGDWIRQTGHVPRTDLFTFTREGVAWIDLHWIFQIAVSWVHQQGGVVALNLAKCAVTCVAMLLLLSARRREWPVWVIILAWLPALLVLGGRMYVRPETLTLLYLSIFLAVLLRWDRRPRLAWLLPPVQVAWVNSHGLFVLGPIVLVFGLIDAALRFGFFTAEAQKVVAYGPGRECAQRRGVPGQSVFHHRCALSARAGRDDEQRDLLAKYRRADADSRLCPEPRASGTCRFSCISQP